MGRMDAPVLSKRKRQVLTWKHGAGMVKIGDKDVSGTRPLLLVRASTSAEARQLVAMKMQQIANRDRVKGATLYGKWLSAGKLVLPRRVLSMMTRARRG